MTDHPTVTILQTKDYDGEAISTSASRGRAMEIAARVAGHLRTPVNIDTLADGIDNYILTGDFNATRQRP